ncbi:GntR family transcriptional regulator [Mycobacterium sp. CVI_P3]|uniref:GntR family transcriptional regulator n=1 Tax=Mycobacterium pinniadriaticum TaxID=2994102 RepID=A0ABT3S9I1_9MYCO|nr:GntR family transcriptional regulator [Mycobacterium pinniadriaticum]MCX2929760.1 GntR family transcriptional regulator [Mycobacterium pinniadriaticum]MCX2936184.1 GntR family transcriptional regulator [Mycobacterium pinniadriaticum]
MSKAHVVRNGLDELLAGLTEGDPVPPERDLAVRFGVARDTVRQALHELLLEGRVQRRGRGTVVAKPKLTQPLSLRSYTEGAERMGRKPGRILVTWEEIEATVDLSAGLEIEVGEPVMHLERVLLADNERIGLESTYLPMPRFAGLYDTFDPETSLYAAIRATGVRFASATEFIETILPTPREAGLLLTTTAMPMLHLRRRSLDADGRPIEMVRALYRGDRVAFQTTLADTE